MWNCRYCGEEITKDKYKVCWNCGKPREEAETPESVAATNKPSFRIEAPVEIKPLAQIEIPQKTALPPPVETHPAIKAQSISEQEEAVSTPESSTENLPSKAVSASQETFLSQYEDRPTEKSGSVIRKIIPVLLWLGAVSGVGYFAYISYQKTENFEKQIAENFQNFNNQKSQFVFPPIPQLRRGDTIEGNLQAKVLPVNVKTSEPDALYSYLPDDLRPSTIDEVKTMMWLDCENNPVGRYPDGTVGFREKCTAFLVERETGKFIGIEEFLGVMPALGKEKAGEDPIGKVLPEKYVAYLRENQPENERGLIQSSSESPNHHIYNKSEFIYAVLLLSLLAAIGFGWLAYNLRFSRKE